MDDQRVGAVFRAIRIRRGLRQADVAAHAGVSTATVSRIERGHFDRLALASVRAVARALEVRLELLPRWRGGDLDRLVNGRHAALAEEVIRRLAAVGGWEVRPEVSFAIYGERGIVDLLAWHEATSTLLVIELKTEIVDVGELLGTLDRKRRLAPPVGRQLGWRPKVVACCLAIAESMTNRRRVEEHAATFAAALPACGVEFRHWLREPCGELRARVFLSNGHRGNVRGQCAGIRRVRASRSVRARRLVA